MAMRRKPMGMMPQENRGAGLDQPVMRPGPMGPGDEQYQQRRPTPEMQPIHPVAPGMEGMNGAMPGGLDDGSVDLLKMLQSMMGGYK